MCLFFQGMLIRRYLYKTLEIGLMTTPYHKENNGNWPSKSCDRSWSLSFCDSVRRSCRWTQFPVFFCHTKLEDPGICKKPWLKAITTKRGDELFGKFKLFPFKPGVVEGFFPNQMGLRFPKNPQLGGWMIGFPGFPKPSSKWMDVNWCKWMDFQAFLM